MVVDDGDTEMLLPLPTSAPPQLPLYHCQLAAVPRLPPLTLRVDEAPLQMLIVVLFIDVAGLEAELVLIVMLWQAVVLQAPTAFTKYVVVDAGFTAMELPLPTAVPVQLPLNHCQLAPVPRLPPLTVRVVVEPAHTVALLADADAGAELRELTVITVDTQAVFPQEPSALR